MRLKLSVMLIILLWLTSGFARPRQLSTGEHTCSISIQVIENFNNEPNVEELFNKVFGGINTVTILKSENNIVSANILNKNGADDLQILIMWNYTKEILEFVGASLVGPVKGTLINCR